MVLNAVLVRAGDYLPEAIWLADIVGGELRAQLVGWADWLAESPAGGVARVVRNRLDQGWTGN